MDILKYKSYEGTTEIDLARGVCRGKILLIDDLVTYECESPRELQKQFEEAVDDYIETCKELGRPAQVPLKGQFNVRVSPDIHKQLVLRAASDEVSLNEVVSRACEAYVCHRDVNHHHNHDHNHKIVVTVEENQVVNRVALRGTGINWESGVANVRSH
ncbi:type II toxin-antitoxin system HicB family antitoxin [Massilia phyllosphaerae]|uniref:type II toxin-antitoxin system HicB family antitoxin n=1 Tax=Massilia phyllosphaerae TaxID=3106034 RepID=UPI002B1CD432|nr:type II toxin-antitoxin system HicB family antitoxin [Massilia sp. SGZ-792]